MKLPKAVAMLCGQGSVLYGASADGTRVKWCHGKAHHRMLHFRNDRGTLEILETEEPTDYLTALGMDGWEGLCERLQSLQSLYACC